MDEADPLHRYDDDVTPHHRTVSLALVVLAATLFAACSAAASSGTPIATRGPTAVPTVRPSIAGPESAGTTETDWGTIWDTLPRAFPTPPGSTPAEETATGPASANLVVEGSDAKGVATAVQLALGATGYKTNGLQGPLEDGSVVLDMTGSPKGCALQVTAKPTGGLTTVTILYGAACPLG